MLSEGAVAPDFSLPGIVDGEPAYYDLVQPLDQGRAALVLFYPCDFVPTITPELRAASAWADRDDLVVYGISADSLFAHEAYADREGITITLLTDTHATIADAYDLVAEEVRGHHQVPARAVLVIAPDWTIRFGWTTDDPLAPTDGAPLRAAAACLDEILDASIDPPE
ncbi:redoxin domain-containing protein [Halococcoides cellulosivorans]|uniref:Alkyl hydroperoxide reductase n=1 Tax=Halococcoides cellulosivorans TaxID=1679096 RepID=A0A2R4WZ83_9EURY|nr:redoxin domain-containing protein [Halococcoides cellulosivorans]AWB26852.1 alkyl hydroperoxide reductase [Halococcoides cellulosivorans]